MKQRKVQRIVLGGIVIACAVTGIFYFTNFFIPQQVHIDDCETLTVERGPVTQYFEAEGIVEARNEVLILSPASSIITKIHKEPGSRVGKGETILSLDATLIEQSIASIRKQLEVKRNGLEKNRLSARSIRVDLDYNIEVKKLRIASLKSQINDENQLLEVGGISPAKIENTKQQLALAEKDLQMVREKNAIRLKQLEADEKGLLLQIEIQERELTRKLELLEKMEVKAPSDGIIMNIYAKKGEKLGGDKNLVRMSDLTTFKIIGSVPEKQAKFIKTGRKVYAIIGKEKLPGKIGNFAPMVENDKLYFNVYLKNNNHPKLIPNQKVQLHVVRNEKTAALRIPHSPATESTSRTQELFVRESDDAIIRKVTLGLRGKDFIEVTGGLDEGEAVIISDLSTLRRMYKEQEN